MSEKVDMGWFATFSASLILASGATYASYLSGDVYLTVLCIILVIAIVIMLIVGIKHD